MTDAQLAEYKIAAEIVDREHYPPEGPSHDSLIELVLSGRESLRAEILEKLQTILGEAKP